MPKRQQGWVKGQSGNPAGRLSAKERCKRHDIMRLAQEHTVAAITALVDVLKDGKAPHSARVQAAGLLLDRGYGKAPQDVRVRGEIEGHILHLVMALDDDAKVIEHDPINGADVSGRNLNS